MEHDVKNTISPLLKGEAPDAPGLLSEITVGINDLADFISRKYFAEYISSGGSKIKFVTGKAGSGKTHFLKIISASAEKQGFVTVHFSAKDIWLHDFKEIYAEIFKQSELEKCLASCAKIIVNELGYDYHSIPDTMSFADYLSSKGEFDAIVKREIRNQLREMFLKNPLIDNNFAIACSLLVGGMLGHPILESANSELLLLWLAGNKDIKLTALRNLGLSPAKITKYNARHMLRSLVEVQKLAKSPGIIITIDNTDILLSSTSFDTIRYTKMKREDAYESIRELIDEIDTLSGVMFFFAFDRQLIDHELSGIKSYQALWLRVQNEIISGRFNKFTDIIDLDKFMAETFTKEILLLLSGRVADVLNSCLDGSAKRINDALAEKFLTEAGFTKTSLPRKVILATVSGSGMEDEV